MRVERTTTIDQPVDRVFEYVSNPENDPTWVPASLRHQMLSPVRCASARSLRRTCGSSAGASATLGKSPTTSRRVPSPCEASPERYPLPSASCWIVAEVQLCGIYKPMEFVMRWVAREQFGTQLRTLKNLLESEAFRDASS